MGIKTLKTASLEDAMIAMNIGETAYAPEGYTPESVRVTCAKLNSKGYIFTSSIRTGTQTITRLQ